MCPLSCLPPLSPGPLDAWNVTAQTPDFFFLFSAWNISASPLSTSNQVSILICSLPLVGQVLNIFRDKTVLYVLRIKQQTDQSRSIPTFLVLGA